MPNPALAAPARTIMSTQVACIYEGWSVDRARHFLARHNLSQAPVIASDHQLVGVLNSAQIAGFLNSDETYRAQAVNDSFRRATGTEIENLDELTQWVRRAQVYCTAHQIMRTNPVSAEAGTSIEALRALALQEQTHAIYLTEAGVLVGVVTALDILATTT
ncbi:CBS domain-containing protein [Gilvimarinus agarilyticus]|uniref:CBS domain-containing protein n=1 Tax=Gilvimarinus agarilyticus TaxID=679259 RepID=UPI00059F9F3B|nr:CBS domain-containing protein [Gilvimarinus agarilyticus]